MIFAQRCLISILLIIIAACSYAEPFDYSCIVTSTVYFDSFDLSYARPNKWPGNWHTQPPAITEGFEIVIAGLRTITGTLIATAEGPPHHIIHLDIDAMTTSKSRIKISLLEDSQGKFAWGFGKYNEHSLFMYCEPLCRK